MTSEFTFTERVRGVLPAGPWWRTNVLSAVTLLFCVAIADGAVHSGHSYWCWSVPIIYAGLWRSLFSCKELLSSMEAENSSPALLKLSSEIHRLALSANILVIVV